MTIRALVGGEDPVLRQACTAVTSFDRNLHQLLDDLYDTLVDQHGIALSAPQIAQSVQVAVVDIGKGRLELINPVIVQTKGSQVGAESCVSASESPLVIERPKWIRLSYRNRDGQTVELEADGLLARVLCHEVDHLHGILFFDHLADEDLWSQLLTQFGVGDFATEDPIEMGEPPDVEAQDQAIHKETVARLTNGELHAIWKEQARADDIRLAIDILTEASWKVSLVLDLLKDSNPTGDLTDSITTVEDACQGLTEVLHELDPD